MLTKRLKSQRVKTTYLNRLHMVSAVIYVTAIFFMGALLTILSSQLERSSLVQESHNAVVEASLYLKNKNDDLWKVYLPMYKEPQNLNSISSFFGDTDNTIETDSEKRKALINTLDKMATPTLDISWIMLHRDSDGTSYLYFTGSGVISKTPSDFPFLAQIKNKPKERFLMGSETIMNPRLRKSSQTYAIAGNIYSSGTVKYQGTVVVGFEASAFEAIYNRYSFSVPTDITVATASGAIIYASDNKYKKNIDPVIFMDKSNQVVDLDGKKMYIENSVYEPNNYIIFNGIPKSELFKKAHKNTFLIWGICIVLASLSAFLYIITGKLSAKKTNIILNGLKEIERNNLSYQVQAGSANDEFDVIANHINHMTSQMQEYVEKVYIYSIKQKSAELGELQAKFNPHFLYNSLEVIRAQLQQNGDIESADMILLLSRIFRSFISQKPFITINEELSLCNMYMKLFQLRYKDEIEVEFDIDTDILEFGIIRNLLQPVIENYFVHGFNAELECNKICISGHLFEDEYILIKIEDNGVGVAPERLSEIENTLQSNVFKADNSYGLKNINDRIKTFYGKDCGLKIYSKAGEFTKIEIKIKKLACEQHFFKDLC